MHHSHNRVSNAHYRTPEYIDNGFTLHAHGCNVIEYLARHVPLNICDSHADALYYVSDALQYFPVERLASLCRAIDYIDNDKNTAVELLAGHVAPGFVMLHYRYAKPYGLACTQREKRRDHIITFSDAHDHEYRKFRKSKTFARYFKSKRIRHA